jgi:DNA primase
MFSKSTLDDIRQRVSIAQLIGERIPLKRAGRNFKGLCPFHKEKSPSFMVSDDKGIYHCFGCGEGGDAFQFVMKFDGATFNEAVTHLAAKVGVEVSEVQDPSVRAAEDASSRHRRLLLRVNEIAREHFESALLHPEKGAKPRAYLQQRGIQGEIITQHRLGMAEDSWDALVGKLSAKNVPLELAAEIGLLKKREGGGYYDFFRGRLMFPIISPRGETIGFGGRTLASGGEGEKAAKYMNSPDSPVYHKSVTVYGLDRSAAAIRSADQVVLVEGYMDFIALHQAGIENVAAPLGTALTQGHVSLLMRYTRNMVLVFDGDEAGQRAAIRALPVFIEAGVMPRVIVLPPGEDPDDVVRKEGAEAFRERLARARPLFEHFVEVTVRETGLDSAGKSEALKRIAPLMRTITDPVDASVLRQHVSRRLDLAEGALEQAIGVGSKATAVRAQGPRAEKQVAVGADRAAERLLIEAMLKYPEMASVVFEKVAPILFCDEWCRTVAGLLSDALRDDGDLDVRRVIEAVEDDELAKQMRAVALEDEAVEEAERKDRDVAALVLDCVSRMLTRTARVRIEAINDDIRSAEGEGDEEKLLRLLAEKKELVEKVRVRDSRVDESGMAAANER